MVATTQGTARIALEILDHINGCQTDEEAVGALGLLIDFLQDVKAQRSIVYWGAVEWGEVEKPDQG